MDFNTLYNDLDLKELIGRYFASPSESKGILLHLNNRSDEERQEFMKQLHLVNATMVANYHKKRIKAGSEKQAIEKLKQSRDLGYYKNYKKTVDDQLKRLEGDGISSLVFLRIELYKQKEILEHFKLEHTASNLEEEKEYYQYIIEQLNRCVKYIIYRDTKIRFKAREDHERSSTNKSIAVIALFHIYLQEAKLEVHFNNYAEGKVAAIKKVASSENINWKNFQIKFNHFYQNPNNRIAPHNIGNLVEVSKLLKGYPSAQKLALADIEKVYKNM
ncbi:hypothetical protein [Rufibacter immobilis]|uniref:hypothetical protein n=1 Tax=Rufibacter immobilis TaxID=1348778 RepID=UPI0035EC1513